jgi:uncharacterized protein YggE
MYVNTRVVLLVTIALLGCRGPEDGSTISTSGSGSVHLTPTKARLTIQVASRGASATEASKQNDTRLQRVLAVLRADSMVDSVRIIQVGVDPSYDEVGKAVAFEAQATIEVLVRHLDGIGRVLDGALLAGATSVGRLAFESDSTAVGRRQALASAFASARADAEALAEASHQRLSSLVSVSAGGTAWPFGANAFEEASVTVGASSAEFGNAQSGIINIGPTPREVVVSASVETKWRVRPN